MKEEYGYCRISTPKQNIDRQERNILEVYPSAHIVKEVFTGTKTIGRKEWIKLYKVITHEAADGKEITLIFDSVSRMSRNAEEGFNLYEELYNLGINPGNCSKFILTKEMRERKAKMDELSQAVIALPGGFGTLEELSEMIVQKQLNYSNKPIVILNSFGFYDNLIKFFDDIINKNFAANNSKSLYYEAKTPIEAVEYINNYEFLSIDYLNKKIPLDKV